MRALRDDPVGFDPAYWRRGAELGWTSLLVDEAHGGGSISGDGLVDLSLVAYEFGHHAAPGPLVPVNIVAAALSEHDAHADVLAGLLAGEAVAAWCAPEPEFALGAWRSGVAVRRDGDDLRPLGIGGAGGGGGTVDAPAWSRRPTATGLTQVLVPASAPGVGVTAMQTRRPDQALRCRHLHRRGGRGGRAGGRAGRGRRRGRAPVPPGRVHPECRVGGCHAGRVRHDRRVGLRPLLLRPAAGLLPGAQAPVRRHEDLARGQPRHQRRRLRRGGRRGARTPSSWSSAAKAYIGAVRGRARAGLRADPRRHRA